MGRAVIIDLSRLDRAVKLLEEGVTALRSIVDRAERGVPVSYTEENGAHDDKLTSGA